MPLRDHFRSPVNDTHSWDEVHGGWPMEMVRHLRTILPAGFRAGPNIHLGSSFEVEIGAFDLDSRDPDGGVTADGGGTVTLSATAPTYTLEADPADQDEYEVRIYDTERGRTLVAAIEIVSPSNKDRQDKRDIFTGKAAGLLQQGVYVSVVDLQRAAGEPVRGTRGDVRRGGPAARRPAHTPVRGHPPHPPHPASPPTAGSVVPADDRRPTAADDPDLAESL